MDWLKGWRERRKYRLLKRAGFFRVGPGFWAEEGHLFRNDEVHRFTWARYMACNPGVAHSTDHGYFMPYSEEYIRDHSAAEIIARSLSFERVGDWRNTGRGGTM